METYFVDTEEKFKDFLLLEETFREGAVVIDTETNSASEKKALLWGLALCFEDNEAYYIPIRDKHCNLLWSDSTYRFIQTKLLNIIERRGIVGHNVLYDTLVLEYNWNRDISQLIVDDTILLKHMVDEERPFGLKEVSVKYLGEWADKAQTILKENIKANGGVITQDNIEMYKADTDVLGEYCAWDTMLTYKLWKLFRSRVEAEDLIALYNDEVLPLYKNVTINMKRRGFTIDVPHFNRLNSELALETNALENSIQADIRSLVESFETRLLEDKHPEKRAGLFPKVLADTLGVELPTNKDGGVTLAKRAVEKKRLEVSDDNSQLFYDWLLGTAELPTKLKQQVQSTIHFKDNPESKSVFNLSSNDHMGWLFFDRLRETPLEKTDTGKPKCDDDFLESVRNKYEWVEKLLDLKKLLKLKSTYVEGILDRQIDGVIYASFLQFGTTSGRFSSTSPNLQNLPRIKDEESKISPLVLKYANAIKEGFVAPDGYVIVNADFSALEPRCFSAASSDRNLQDIFHKGEDMYSSIAKRVFSLEGSVFKKDIDFIGKKYPEKRQTIKTLALAVTYGASANRIAKLMGISSEEAQQLIDDYLEAYPGLRDYIKSCHEQTKKYGVIRTKFGRVRHLKDAVEIYRRHGNKILEDYQYVRRNDLSETKYRFKNLLNNSTNFPIQGLAAHICNRAMIALDKKFKELSLDAYIVAMVHDEITCIAKKDIAEQVGKLLKNAMENTVKIEVPLVAEPQIALNWAEAK